MEIKYFENGETTIARGFNNTVGPEGVPEDVFLMTLYSKNMTSRDHEILMSCSDFTSTASPFGEDTYDKQIGHDIARDKTILKYCNREQKQLDIIKNELERQLANVNTRIAICDKKKMNAENRLASH